MSNLILYGAGVKADKIYKMMEYQGLSDKVTKFCVSSKQNNVNQMHQKDVVLYSEIKDTHYSFIIAVEQNTDAFYEIEKILQLDNQLYYKSLKEWELARGIHSFERDAIAFFHINHSYYDVAESFLEGFWNKESVFYKMFSQLNTRSIVELGCGHGRHVPKYLLKAKKITLVDVLNENIEFCKKRFVSESKIKYLQNNGHDLHELSTGGYSSLFTYDAMVHFELIDIAEYIRETYRILEHGGMALYHHSNNDSNYKASYLNAPHSRSFMSDKIFAYLAYRAGFEIIEQKIIDWGGVPNLDCLTLVKKN